MKKTLLNFVLVSIIVFITIFGCKKKDDSNNNNNNNKVLKFLNVANAKSLVIMNSSSKKSSMGVNDDSGNKLFKITEDGVVIEVSCIDENGETVTNSFFPQKILNLSSNYFIIMFQNYGVYLVRKSDGAVFNNSNNSKFPNLYSFDQVSDRKDLLIQQDSLGNIYYISGQEVEQLNVSDPNNLTISTYSAVGDQVAMFAVDNAGNMVYSMMPSEISRYRHVNGSYNNFGGNGFWSNIENNTFYAIKRTTNSYNVVKINPSPFNVENYGDSTFQISHLFNIAKIKNKKKIVGDGYGIGQEKNIFEIYNEQGVLSNYPYSYFNILNIDMLASSDNYYYIVGTNPSYQSVLLKVDPNGHTFTNLLTTGDYDIYNVVVNSADELQFYALRMSDGKRVLAEIDNTGNVTVISVLEGNTVTALERIN